VSRRVLALNVLLGLVGALCAAGLIRELLTPLPLPPPPTPRSPAPTTTSVPAPTPGGSAGAYGLVVSKNLFSPSRSEAPAGPVVAAGPRPLLHGVVMDGPKSRAYLEDATVKRTFGYGIGDAINGGRVQSIGEDRVVIARPDGLVEVLLQDPAKPRPAGPPAAGATPPAAAPAATATTPPAAPSPPAVPVSRVPAAGSAPPRANER
jgi:hypothetical protein